MKNFDHFVDEEEEERKRRIADAREKLAESKRLERELEEKRDGNSTTVVSSDGDSGQDVLLDCLLEAESLLAKTEEEMGNLHCCEQEEITLMLEIRLCVVVHQGFL